MSRWIGILLLGLINVILLFWYSTAPDGPPQHAGTAGSPAFEKDILQNAIAGVLRAQRIGEHAIRERSVQPGVRTEMRVRVPPEISMTTLNFEIHRTARALGYSISAREDSRTGRVSIHIRDHEAIVLTVLLLRQ